MRHAQCHCGIEVISPTSGRTDRIVKVREYAAVPSVLRYVVVQSSSIGLTVLERQTADRYDSDDGGSPAVTGNRYRNPADRVKTASCQYKRR